MIIKGAQRGSGTNLASHLLKADDNEHVLVHEIRGFASDNLHDAFREAEAISLGTKCEQYLFSVSVSPPPSENVSVEVFKDTFDRIEKQLGLEGQPRAIVFHEKENRLHAHGVWSRIDANTMTAKQLSFFKMKLFELSRDLHLELGYEMPKGMANKGERDPTNFSLAEWQQAKRQGIDPRWLKKSVQDCWASSDDNRSFQNSLQERGLFLAKGDKRGHVLLDHEGEFYSLARMLGVKSKDVRARLGDLEKLQSVADTKKLIAQKMTPVIRRHIDESRERFRDRSNKLGEYKAEMTKLHRKAREKLNQKHQQEWDAETLARAKRLPKGLRGLWHRLTGKYRQVRRQNEKEASATCERHAEERLALVDKQRAQRAVLQTRFKELRGKQATQLNALRKDIGRYMGFAGKRTAARSRGSSLGLKLHR